MNKYKMLALVLVGVALSITVSASPAYAATDPSLKAHWAFDEASGVSIGDSSGNSQTGTNYGGVISTDVPPTIFANSHSLRFDGASTYAESPSQAALSASHSRSISMWFKTGVTNQNQGMFESGAPANHQMMQIATVAAGGVGGNPPTNPGGIAMAFYDLDIYVPNGITNVANNVWHLVTYTYDQSTNQSTLYFDGVAVQAYLWDGSAWSTLQAQPFVLPGTPSTAQNSVLIGRSRSAYFGQGNSWFDGNIDDVRIYDMALTSTQVARLAGGNDNAILPAPVTTVTAPSQNTAATSVVSVPNTGIERQSWQLPIGVISMIGGVLLAIPTLRRLYGKIASNQTPKVQK